MLRAYRNRQSTRSMSSTLSGASADASTSYRRKAGPVPDTGPVSRGALGNAGFRIKSGMMGAQGGF